MSTIKDLRKKHDLTQHQLADITGIPFRTIQNWEGGQRKCPEYVEMLLVFYLEHTLNNDKRG
jgi:DNA-binding transcriptional regulator YiaG